MKAVFLSDAHLIDESHDRYRNMLRFLDELDCRIDHLFIVGDFFDFWLCRRNNMYPSFRPVVKKLISLKSGGMEISLFEGNHDFFLGDYFEPLGFHVYSESALLELDGRRIYISHGDMVDYTNTSYLKLRKLLRCRPFYLIQRYMWLPLLWEIARLSSKISKNHLAKSPDRLTAIMREFAFDRFREGVDTVILGHSHMPIIRNCVTDGSEKTFCVLGDWINHYSYLTMIDGKLAMNYFNERKRQKNLDR